MTVPPQLTSSLPSFSYPASFRHPPPASSGTYGISWVNHHGFICFLFRNDLKDTSNSYKEKLRSMRSSEVEKVEKNPCAPLVHQGNQVGFMDCLVVWCGVHPVFGNWAKFLQNCGKSFLYPKRSDTFEGQPGQLWGTVDCFCFAVSPFRLHRHRIKEWLDIIPPFTIASIRIADVEYDAPISPWVIIAGWFSMILGVCSSPYLSLRRQICFLDMTSIHQSDNELLQRGIYSIGGCLSVSKELRVLYSPPYFGSLWCLFELVAFRNSNPTGKIKFLPLSLEFCPSFLDFQNFTVFLFAVLGFLGDQTNGQMGCFWAKKSIEIPNPILRFEHFEPIANMMSMMSMMRTCDNRAEQVLRTFGSCWSILFVLSFGGRSASIQISGHSAKWSLGNVMKRHCKTKSSCRRVVTFGEF